tara:strand:- start:1378 stop:3216 length:1839 start_codon:yes stop_codon:yes gene_type:complete
VSLDPKTFKSIISAHISKAQKEHATWDKWRAWYRSEFWGDQAAEGDDPLLVENNYLYAFCDTMVASVTPPTPRVTAAARKSGEQAKLAAKYREALINDILYRSDAHEVLWKMGTLTSVYGRSIVKAVWNFTLDRPDFVVLDPRYFFYDMSASRWDDIRYAVEVTTLTKAEFFARTEDNKGQQGLQYDPVIARKAQLGSFPKWLQDKEGTTANLNKEVKNVFEWVVVYEVYDFTEDKYYHMLEDEEEPLFAGELPYVFVRNPFKPLVFTDNLADIGGLADSQLVERQQRRLNELDTLELRHAQSSIPVTVINEALCDNPEDFVDQVASATSPGDVVRLQGRNAAPLSEILSNTPTSNLAPEFATIRERIEATVQFVLGIPDYARGVAGTADVATELALVDSAMRTRLGRRTKMINGVIRHMAKAIIGLYEEYLEPESEIPVRLTGDRETFVVSRAHLMARSPEIAEEIKASGGIVEEPLAVDYEIVPYSPTENSKAAQVKKIIQFLEFLAVSEHIDQRRLHSHILDLLDIGDDVLISEEELKEKQMAEVRAMQAQAQGMQAMAQGGGGEDTIATGGMPPGASDVPTGAVGAMEGGAGSPTPAPPGMGGPPGMM